MGWVIKVRCKSKRRIGEIAIPSKNLILHVTDPGSVFHMHMPRLILQTLAGVKPKTIKNDSSAKWDE